MTPREFQEDTIQRRLVSLRRILGELEKYRNTAAHELRANLSHMYAVFFMIQQIIDLATDINQHIATTSLDCVDSTSRRGFENLIRAEFSPQSWHRIFTKVRHCAMSLRTSTSK